MTGREINLGTVLVTGGSGTIGRAILEELSSHADSLVTVSRTEKTIAPAQAVIPADLSGPQGIEAVSNWLADHGPAHTLVNNAGIYQRRDLGRNDWENWTDILSINLVAAAELTRICVAAGCTRVINLVDAGWHRAWPNHSAYLATKAALVSLTRSLAAELAPAVQVNAVAPGIVTLPADAGISAAGALERVPAGRLGRPDEVAAAVASLLTGPSYLTGQVLAVDGGYGHR